MQSRSEFIKESPKTLTALITPFKNDKIDFDSLKSLLDFQIKNGIDGFIISGTTGESPTLEENEVEELFLFCKKILSKDFPLWLGTGTNNTKKTIDLTKKAKELGAQAALVCVPYYNKPTQRGLFEHYKSLTNLGIPVVLYNVPGRTVVSLEAATIKALAKENNIYGLKEASGNGAFYKPILTETMGELLHLSGDDLTYIDFLKSGGDGVISVATHVLPKLFVNWRNQVHSGDVHLAEQDLNKYKKLIELLFVVANPIPVKKALQLMGIIDSAALRLPLTELEEKHTDLIKSELKKLELI
ncbi:MAG TPA: 4-hydroxy-tetrahydrodipicolinate synthase [Pseudobdellovibrionaceae bacterium]|nr:4-hydroxy-tetrahydrodipicolinate synthase [Pseudobdellovibrionaceae bacterium]